MHELGVVIEVVRVVEEFAKENQVEEIDTLILQIGELSSMIPKYIREVYPAAVDGTMLSGTKLQIEIIPGNGRCRECEKIYNVLAQRGNCPKCGSQEKELLSGREFNIKEIICH